MKAVISSTYDDKYLFFLPITAWCWNRLGVDVICFMPYNNTSGQRFMLVSDTLVKNKANGVIYNFDCPEYKEATYSQCSRLYAACLDLPEDEILVTSDIDMILFKKPPYEGGFTIFGSDLVPARQYPMCYISATVKNWRSCFELIEYEYDGSIHTPNGVRVGGIKIKTYQQCLDETIGKEECENMRGNLWGRDQETAYNKINLTQELNLVPRSNGKNQFAMNRVDRTDTNWRSYVTNDLIDAHLWRPGYTEENFANIMELMTTMYPNEDFTWLKEYRDKYVGLL